MASGDETSFEHWVRQYQAFLYRAAWALTGERALAQDLVQETFTQAWRARAQLRQPAAVQGWLYRILCRAALRQRREPWAPWDEADCAGAVAELPALDARIDLVRALQRIAPAHREILVLHYLTDLDYAQLAAALDIPAGTVMSRLNRARHALRRALGEDDTDDANAR